METETKKMIFHYELLIRNAEAQLSVLNMEWHENRSDGLAVLIGNVEAFIQRATDEKNEVIRMARKKRAA